MSDLDPAAVKVLRQHLACGYVVLDEDEGTRAIDSSPEMQGSTYVPDCALRFFRPEPTTLAIVVRYVWGPNRSPGRHDLQQADAIALDVIAKRAPVAAHVAAGCTRVVVCGGAIYSGPGFECSMWCAPWQMIPTGALDELLVYCDKRMERPVYKGIKGEARALANERFVHGLMAKIAAERARRNVEGCDYVFPYESLQFHQVVR